MSERNFISPATPGVSPGLLRFIVFAAAEILSALFAFLVSNSGVAASLEIPNSSLVFGGGTFGALSLLNIIFWGLRKLTKSKRQK